MSLIWMTTIRMMIILKLYDFIGRKPNDVSSNFLMSSIWLLTEMTLDFVWLAENNYMEDMHEICMINETQFAYFNNSLTYSKHK